MSLRSTILLSALCAGLVACSSSRGTSGMTDKEKKEGGSEERGRELPSLKMVSKKEWKKRSTDPFRYKEVRIEGNVLVTRVRYSGGCKEHDLELWASPYTEKSDPPQKSLFLKHDANGDACRSVIHDTLRFDLSSLRTPMILRPEGYEKSIRYGP